MHNPVVIEHRTCASVAWQKGRQHKFYEDRFRLLCHPIPLVKQKQRGEIFAVLDGVGSAPQGMAAAQAVCDVLVNFFDNTSELVADQVALQALLTQANETIRSWGVLDGTDRALGACAGTIIWIDVEQVAHVFHAGDTTAILIRNGDSKTLTTVHHTAEGHLSNYFGLPVLQLENTELQLVEGDRLLLFSDGIGKAFFNNQQIANIIEAESMRQTSLTSLFSYARAGGSGDDATAILIDIEPQE